MRAQRLVVFVPAVPFLAALLLAAACEEATPLPPAAPPAAPPAEATALPGLDEPVPALRLPADIRPTAEAIELHVDPGQDRFSGAVDIDVTLEHPRRVVWLHGKDMHVTAATVTPDGGAPIAATWQEHGENGMASLSLASRVR